MTTAVRYLSPQEVAEILGVGVSTVKRLVDGGRLSARTTVGGHRRIEPGEVLRLVNSGNYPCANRALLERRCSAVAAIDLTELTGRMHAALLGGDAAVARSLAVASYEGGLSIARLGDEVVAPVMARIGHGWEARALDVYEEHRATQTCLAALAALRERVEGRGREGSPLAVGGGPEGDHYLLANQLVELMLLDMGWRVINVGPNTPISSFAEALGRHRPALLWLSCSHVADEASLASGYAGLHRAARRLGARAAVGGNAVTDGLRARLPAEHHGNTLAGLEAFVRTLG